MSENEKLLREKLKEALSYDPKDLSDTGLIACGLALLLKNEFPERTIFDDVCDFHEKFKINYSGPPRDLPSADLFFRQARLEEEFTEYMDATTRAEMFDALIDLIYIALGTIHLHGWNFNEGWRRVHDANMRKVLSSKENPGKYGAKIDVVKPANWIAPDLKDLA